MYAQDNDYGCKCKHLVYTNIIFGYLAHDSVTLLILCMQQWCTYLWELGVGERSIPPLWP